MLQLTRRSWLAGSASSVLPQLRALPLAQMRLGVTTDEIDEDVLTAVRFLRRFELGWAEVRSLWGNYNTSQPLETVRRARAIFDEHGVKVSIEGTAVFKVPLPPDTAEGKRALDVQWALLEASMERARIFGTQKLRVFGFLEAGSEPRSDRTLPRVYELLREAARRAKAGGFRLALENVGGSYIATGAQAGELLKHVKDAKFGLTWDPNNAGAAGEKAFPDGYRALDPARIFHVHLRDYRHMPDGTVGWSAVGDGEFDNLGQIQALLKDGFHETFSLETHWRSPKGKAYASETSLRGLLKVIERV